MFVESRFEQLKELLDFSYYYYNCERVISINYSTMIHLVTPN